MHNHIVEQKNIIDLIDECQNKIKRIHSLIDNMEEEVSTITIGETYIDTPNKKEIANKINRVYWDYFISQTRINDYKTDREIKDMFNVIHSDEGYSFNSENVLPIVTGFTQIVNDSVSSLFSNTYKELIGIPYSGLDKKSNLRKVEQSFRFNGFGMSYIDYNGEYAWSVYRGGSWQLIRDLYKCFKILNEDKDIEGRDEFYEIMSKREKIIDFKYFALEAYKNGNVMFRMNNEYINLLDEFNKIGSKDNGNILTDNRKKDIGK